MSVTESNGFGIQGSPEKKTIGKGRGKVFFFSGLPCIANVSTNIASYELRKPWIASSQNFHNFIM